MAAPPIRGQKRGGRAAPLHTGVADQLEAHPNFGAVRPGTISNRCGFIVAWMYKVIGNFVSQIVDEEVHAPAILVDTGPKVSNTKRVLRVVGVVAGEAPVNRLWPD